VALGVSRGRSNGVLALSKSVPKLDGLITGTRNDLTVVYGEGNREDVLVVTNETTGGATRVDFPKTQGSIPRSTECELSIRTDHDIRYEVGVSAECAAGVAVFLISTAGVGELPDKDGLVTRRRKKDVGVLGGGGDGGHPVGVPGEGAAKRKGLRHC